MVKNRRVFLTSEKQFDDNTEIEYCLIQIGVSFDSLNGKQMRFFLTILHRRLILIFLFALIGSNSVAFSLLGPFTSWMDDVRSYRSGALGGPMYLGEEYRWNVPVVTYGFDQTFLDYFGLYGVNAVEEAVQILNSLPPASQMSPNLTEFSQTAKGGTVQGTSGAWIGGGAGIAGASCSMNILPELLALLPTLRRGQVVVVGK